MAKRSAKCPQCGSRMELEAQTGEFIACPQCQAHLTVNVHKTGERDHTKKPAAPPDPLIGKTLCEFEILALLGRGGMGAVYRAKDTKLDRQVAVKVLAPQYARDPKFVQRFEREARAAAAVNHTHIIQIHSVGEHGGHRYIAMELVEGLTLADVLRADGAMPVKRAMGVMKQLASALAEAHGKGVIHRDVKPANIILATGDQVKVTDFGIAKRPEVDVNVTQAGKLMGTATYLPPETARGKPFDARSDLYSLGITFYEMLSGHPPFEGDTTAELIAHHLETEPPPLSESVPDVPSSLCRLVHRLLSKDPAGRPQSASELLSALAGLSGASRIGPRRSAGKVPTANKAERSKLLIPGVIAAAVLAIGLGFVLTFGLGGDDPGPEQGEPPSVAKPVVAKPPAWQADWKAAEAEADALAKARKFGEAIAVYQALGAADDDPDLGEKIYRSATVLHGQAAAAWRRVRDRAQSLIDQKKYDEATAALRPALDVFGVAEHAQEARTMLAKIAAAQAAAKPTTRPVVIKPPPLPPATQPVVVKPTPKTQPAPATQPKPSPADDLRRKRDAQYTQALRPVEALVAAWDFTGAEAALAKVKFEDKELTQRLATRRDELQRLTKLKAKIIDRANTLKPWLKRGSGVVPGSGGKKIKTVGMQITKATDQAVTVTEVTVQGETPTDKPWPKLADKEVATLLKAALSDKSADDQLAAGLLALARPDSVAAQRHFDKAKSLGATIDAYLGPLAATAFDRALALLEKGEFAQVDKALADIEKKYAAVPWLTSHRTEFAAARGRATAGVQDAGAEKLYAQAARHFAGKSVWDLKPVIQKLQSSFGQSKAVTDTTRKPTFAEMAKAVASLGKFLIVRQDGKGDFTKIQAAIDAAPSNSLIEIQDDGPYKEKLLAPAEKDGLTLRGAKDCWPLIASTPSMAKFSYFLEFLGAHTTLERLVVVFRTASGGPANAVRLGADSTIRSVVAKLYASGWNYTLTACGGWGHAVESCFLSAPAQGVGGTGGPKTVKNSFLLTGQAYALAACSYENTFLEQRAAGGKGFSARHCTLIDVMKFSGGAALTDCIVKQIDSGKGGTRIEHCNVFGQPPFLNHVKPGKGCFRGDPQFRDPDNLDYRLKKTSPCRGKASDGGDVGMRYTPEMIEIIQKALELRKKGIIKF